MLVIQYRSHSALRLPIRPFAFRMKMLGRPRKPWHPPRPQTSQLCLHPGTHSLLSQSTASVSHLNLHAIQVMPSKGRMPATRGSTTMAPARDYSTACSYEQDRARVARLNLIVHHVTVSLIGRLPGSTLLHTASGTERSTLLRPNSHHATQICPSRYASLAESVQLRRKRLNDINRPIVRGGTRG
jgi:hypothetical protein